MNIYFIQAKGEEEKRARPRYSFQIQYVIGEIVLVMHKVGPEIHYGIALPETVAENLRNFGLEGLKCLNLHLFIIQDDGLVRHLAPKEVLEYVKYLQERDDAYLRFLERKGFREQKEDYFSTISTPP